jgi:hypothetical protein
MKEIFVHLMEFLMKIFYPRGGWGSRGGARARVPFHFSGQKRILTHRSSHEETFATPYTTVIEQNGKLLFTITE